MLWRMVSNNLSLKLIALAMAVTLALFLKSESHSTIVGYVVPIEIRNLPKNKVLLRTAKPEAQVRMRGPWFVLAQLASTPPVFRVSVPEKLGTSFRVNLNIQDLNVPSRIEVLSIEPATVDLQFDDLATRAVPVVVPRINALPADLQMKGLAVEPQAVELSGPQAALAALSVVESDPIDVSQLRGSQRMTVPLRLPPWVSSSARQEVVVQVTVAAIESQRVFERVPVEVRNSSGVPLSVAPSSVRVTAIGEKPRIDALQEKDIIPFVRVLTPPKAGDRFGVQVEGRDGIARFEIVPAEIKSSAEKPASPKKPVEKR